MPFFGRELGGRRAAWPGRPLTDSPSEIGHTRPIPYNEHSRRYAMSWKTPKIIEVGLGAEINSYACAGLR